MAEDDKETPALLILYQQFGDSTSMHGIGRVLTNSSRWKRVLWSMMFMLCVAFSVYQFVVTINDYYSYPVTTEVILHHESVPPFSGVTFCNLNMVKKSKIDNHIQEMMETYGKPGGSTWDAIRHELLHNNTKADINESGHQILDILMHAEFSQFGADKNNFIRLNTATYGACYTYNKKGSGIFSSTTRGGPEFGLIMELHIDQDEYLPITSGAGVKVIVHPTDEYPFPEDSGVLVHPGTSTSIEVKKGKTQGLPAPYSTCVDASGQGSTQRNLYPNTKYMQKACLKSCLQLTLYEKCGCCDSDMPCDYYTILNVDNNTTTNETVPKLQFCEYFSYSNLCPDMVQGSYLKSELDCDERCPPACDRTTYDTVVSSALWPSDSIYNDFLKDIKDSSSYKRVLQNKSFADNASLERYIRSNFLKIDVFLDKLEFLEFTAHAKYDWNLLLGTLGGLLGLWLGFSLLTAMEIVEVVIDTVLNYTRRKHTVETTSQTEQN